LWDTLPAHRHPGCDGCGDAAPDFGFDNFARIWQRRERCVERTNA
jgi:hypothetical protein